MSGKPTPAERKRVDWLARLIAPKAWAEYDSGKGRCSNAAGAACLESVRAAQRIVAAERGSFPPGTLKRLHVDKHVLAANRKTGARNPPLTIQHSKGSTKASRVRFSGSAEFVYSPDKPLSCGAVAWVETRAELHCDDEAIRQQVRLTSHGVRAVRQAALNALACETMRLEDALAPLSTDSPLSTREPLERI